MVATIVLVVTIVIRIVVVAPRIRWITTVRSVGTQVIIVVVIIAMNIHRKDRLVNSRFQLSANVGKESTRGTSRRCTGPTLHAASAATRRCHGRTRRLLLTSWGWLQHLFLLFSVQSNLDRCRSPCLVGLESRTLGHTQPTRGTTAQALTAAVVVVVVVDHDDLVG